MPLSDTPGCAQPSNAKYVSEVHAHSAWTLRSVMVRCEHLDKSKVWRCPASASGTRPPSPRVG